MTHRIREIASATLAVVIGVVGWLATLWAASGAWAGVAYSAIVGVMLAAAFRGRFASDERARDYWTGFALFGLVHLLAGEPSGDPELMTGPLVDLVGDRLLGDYHPPFPTLEFEETVSRRGRLTVLGRSLAEVPVVLQSPNIWPYLDYLRETTKRFATLGFATIGGLAGLHLRRRALRAGWSGGIPPLGIAWLFLLAASIGGTLALHARPVIVSDGWLLAECPGSETAHFALFNVELLAVLFAALEARFAPGRHRTWWLGFALGGGAGLLASRGSLAGVLPTGQAGELFDWAYSLAVGGGPNPINAIRRLGPEGQEAKTFLQHGRIWAGLAAFLPAAWLGSLAATIARRIGRKPKTLKRPGRRSRWTIGRVMIGVAALAPPMAAIANPSEHMTALLVDLIVAAILFAALRASFGPRAVRAWWWGFALVGGVDLLVGAKVDYAHFAWGVISPSDWPIHEAVARLHLAVYKRQIGREIPAAFMFSGPDSPNSLIYHNYFASRRMALTALCLLMGWAGATLAVWLDRRRKTRSLRANFPNP